MDKGRKRERQRARSPVLARTKRTEPRLDDDKESAMGAWVDVLLGNKHEDKHRNRETVYLISNNQLGCGRERGSNRREIDGHSHVTIEDIFDHHRGGEI